MNIISVIDIFFEIATRQAIRRGLFHSVKDLETAIGVGIDGSNDRAHPFTWTKNADEIIPPPPSPHKKQPYNPQRQRAIMSIMGYRSMRSPELLSNHTASPISKPI